MKGKATVAFINNERKNSKGKDVCTYIKATVRRIALEKKNKVYGTFLLPLTMKWRKFSSSCKKKMG